MVNFYHTNDPNRHTCEIQFCLSHMLNVRAEGGGHHDFHMFRGSGTYNKYGPGYVVWRPVIVVDSFLHNKSVCEHEFGT